MTQDVWQTIYNKLPDEDIARFRGTDRDASVYFAQVQRGRIRTVYTQKGLEKALGENGVQEIRLSSRNTGDRFSLRGHGPNQACQITATGESAVDITLGAITVLGSATVTSNGTVVNCQGGYVTMTGGTATVTGGTVHATNPRTLNCSGGETNCYGNVYTANVSGGKFLSHGAGTVNASANAEVFAANGTVRASGGTVQAEGPAIVYASAGTVWAYGGARIDATGNGVNGSAQGQGHADVVGEGCLIKAGGASRITARAGTKVLATDNAVVDADNSCTVYTVGDHVMVENVRPIPAATIEAVPDADFTGW
ncbi:hypothetical protein ACTVZO_00015 [Streptomyces sp. IBSNAI002]|uniref:hypothetical protein n=1 Tax=Streptomyces sp. IBSNAI002 TaxID=3457500 RepID=UPI003FD5714B